MLEDRYRQYAAETYLEVPDDGFSRLKTLCDEHPMTNYEGITEFILRTLHTTATYTPYTGSRTIRTGSGGYFLLEKGSGYCQHFCLSGCADVPVLQYPGALCDRISGEGGCLYKQEDGSYRAVLDDGSAHA